MGRKIDCPWGGFIELPDTWLGQHARRRDEAAEKAGKLPDTFRRFAIAMALLENWGELPGLGGNPEKWDFEAVSWPVLSWVADVVFTDLALALSVPKKTLPPSPAGSTAVTETTTETPPGTSEQTPPA
jgi:hypothetical protein